MIPGVLNIALRLSGMPEETIAKLDAAMPHTAALVRLAKEFEPLLREAMPLIEKAQPLIAKATPIIKQALPEIRAILPAADALIEFLNSQQSSVTEPPIDHDNR